MIMILFRIAQASYFLIIAPQAISFPDENLSSRRGAKQGRKKASRQ
jgi:hypothetical protein